MVSKPYSFKNDYSEGAHPAILQALLDTNSEQEEGYGLDRHSLEAIRSIRKLTGDPRAEVHLISGGTQTNLIAVAAFLRPHEACITAETGHIATHETGAIEATGHKLLTVVGKAGKLTPELIRPALEEHHFEHMVLPRLVYISNPTELGTVYSFDELSLLSRFCRDNNLLLYLDGARLGAALMYKPAELSIERLYTLTDAFFIGGTKNGALLGEALVIRTEALKRDFRYLLKQKGGLLAKGRVLGIQFEQLFKNNLYEELAAHANEMAQILAKGLTAEGCSFLIDSPTNQIFPIMANKTIETLLKQFDFYIWKKLNPEESAVRIVTSWTTTIEQVERLLAAYKEIH
ncbi:MAG: threonine aldolase [Proteobacteria bacterium]|nr:MAG: threonine aldolase [Pseudomonadota bacterium]